MRRALALCALLAAPLLRAETPDWVLQAARGPQASYPSSPDAVVLTDETRVTVNGDQSMTTLSRRTIRILTAAGRDRAAAYAYFGKDGKVLSMHAWLIDAKGKEHQLRDRDALEASATSFELYSDTKVRMLRPEAVDIGSVFAYEIEQRDRPWEQGLIWRFQETVPVRKGRLELVLPGGMPYNAKWVHWTAPAPKPTTALVWELRDIPAIADEPHMPSAGAVGGWMGVQWGAPRAWSDVAGWYRTLSDPRTLPDAAITAKARALGELRDIARFAQLDVRYVAVEIGIGGYQPHPAPDVFRNRFGDCKDKATLLRSMLAERGIESYSVLVHTTRGMVEPSFPSIGSFNHVITAIRIPRETAKGFPAAIEHAQLGTLLLFDPTSTMTPFGQLPPYLQASRGLLVTRDGGDLIDFPPGVPEASELRRVAKLRLDEDGALHGTVEETRTGNLAASMRGWLQPLDATARVRGIESTIANHLAHYTTADVTIDGLEDPEKALIVRYAFTAGKYATRVADMLIVRPRVLGQKGEGSVPFADRQYAYVTDGPSLQTDDFEIALPAAAAPDELPKPVTLSTPQLQYSSSSSFENGVLRYRRRYVMLAHAIDRDAIPALNEAFAKIGADERASAVFK